MSHVLYLARIIPAYRRPILERLNERLDGRLVVGSGMPPPTSSLRTLTDHGSRGYRHIALENLWLRGESLHAQPFRRAFRKYGTPRVLLAEESPRSVTLPLLLRYAQKRGIRRLLWGHFSSNNRAFSEEHWTDRYRIKLARSVEGCVCYTESIADMLRAYVPDGQLFVAPNTLDTDTLFALYDALYAEGKSAVRQRIGVPVDAPVLTFIGRLIPEKGTDRLLEVFRALRVHQPATLFVIGAGSEGVAMRARVKEEGIEGVHFLGAMPDRASSAPYLFASDIMLMPGYLGLAVNHAFAFAVPVVSQQSPDPAIRYHSPEVDFLRSGYNGILTRHNSTEALLAAVQTILADQERFSRHAWLTAREELTIDRMVDGLVEAIQWAESGWTDPTEHRP